MNRVMLSNLEALTISSVARSKKQAVYNGVARPENPFGSKLIRNAVK
jgi:hypothetical protein